MAHRLKKLEHCLNCGCAVSDEFCSHCGQENEDQRASFGALAEDLFAEIAYWDSKLVRTMKALLFRPGHLTKEYNAGKRVGYLSPFRMYLTISAIFFLVAARQGINVVSSTSESAKARTSARAQTNAAEKEVHDSLGGIITVDSDTTSSSNGNDSSADDSGWSKFTINGQRIDFADPQKTINDIESSSSTLKKHDLSGRIGRLLIVNLLHNLIKYRTDPQAFSDRIFNSSSQLMFFLVPLFALQLAFLYRKSKYFFVEHLVFSVHCHAYAFAILTIKLILPMALLAHYHLSFISSLLTLGMFVYLFLAMWGVYGQTLGKTIWKFILAGSGYVCILGLGFLTLLLLTLFE